MHIKPKRSLGQNFLIDPNIRRKIIQSCGLTFSDTVIEIGSGKGELTRLIAQRAKSVFALELDRRLLETLENNLYGCHNVHVINEDILKADLAALINIGKERAVVVGNIPYYITTPIIERLFECSGFIDRIFLMVQKEFALRIAASPGSKDYGAFSLFVQYHSSPKILFYIKRKSFYPAPKPDSAFIKLELRKTPYVKVQDEARLFKVIRQSFSQRRKTLRNSLEGFVAQEKIKKFFETSSLNENTRPEDLSLQDFAKLVD